MTAQIKILTNSFHVKYLEANLTGSIIFGARLPSWIKFLLQFMTLESFNSHNSTRPPERQTSCKKAFLWFSKKGNKPEGCWLAIKMESVSSPVTNKISTIPLQQSSSLMGLLPIKLKIRLRKVEPRRGH